MVRIATSNQEADRVTSKLFLSSVSSWYKKEGIHVGVEKVSNLFPNKNNKKKQGIAVTLSILGEMEKCRARVVEDGEVVKVENEKTGNIEDEIEIISDPGEVTFFMNVNTVDKEKGEFSVHPKSSCFPLFNYAFMESGDLPKDNEKGFICSIDELKEALVGLDFNATAKSESFQGGNSYFVLVPKEHKIFEDE